MNALALPTFYGYSGESCLQIFPKAVSLRLAQSSRARDLLEIATETWRGHLPERSDDLFAWCLGQSMERLLDLLAHCAALSVNAVQAKIDRTDSDRLLHADALAAALSLDGGVVHTDARQILRRADEEPYRQGVAGSAGRRHRACLAEGEEGGSRQHRRTRGRAYRLAADAAAPRSLRRFSRRPALRGGVA